MAPIIPRKSEDQNDGLAKLVVVSRFYNAGCADTGGLGLAPSRCNTDPLYEIMFRDSGRGSLACPRAGRKRPDLKEHYKAIEFEGSIVNLTREELEGSIPSEEKGICKAVYPVGVNCNGKNIVKVYLFK